MKMPTLKRRQELLGHSLRDVLVHQGVIAKDASATGPELIHAAQDFVKHRRRHGKLTNAEVEAMCRAHDAEDAAQKGEPSPWRDDFVQQAGKKAQKEFRDERIASMREALKAVGLE